MANISKEVIREIHDAAFDALGLSEGNKTQRGWYNTDCPFCGKEGHLGVLLKDEPPYLTYNCFKCPENGSLYKIMKHIGQLDVWKLTRPKLGNLNEVEKYVFEGGRSVDEEESFSLETIHPPRRFKEIEYSSYLEGRGFEKWQYKVFGVGESKSVRFKNYVIFQVKLKGELTGYLGRSTFPNKVLKEMNADIKKFGGTPIPKYKNSSTDFGKTFGGYDEITEITKRVILVEGILDKASVDRYIRSYIRDGSTVCLCTFGKGMSSDRMKLLRSTEVNELSIMYDPDATADIKHLSNEMEREVNVSVKVVPLQDDDPGKMSVEGISEALSREVSPTQFYYNRVDKPEI